MTTAHSGESVAHDRVALQRVLYEIVRSYEQARAPVQHVPPRRFEWLRRPVTLGGDSEILRDRIRIGKQMLQENGWWPNG